MKEKMYYVLVQDWNFGDGDADISVRLYDSLEHAKEVMQAEANLWERVADISDLTIDKDELYIEYYKEYEYDYNHMVWRIYERGIEKK